MHLHKKYGLLICAAILLAFIILSFQKTEQPQLAAKTDSIPQEITLLFMGDIMQHMPQIDAAWDENLNRYVYDSCFRYVQPLISSADLAIANFETTLAGKPYSGYPQFCAPDELVQAMLNAGIDLAGTCNNHSCDKGKKGIERTISVMDSLGLQHFGTYKDSLSYRKQNPLLLMKKGFRLAFLNYTYGTNGIPVPAGNIVSLIDTNTIFKDLKAAKDSIPDKIIVFIHWGEEYQREPNDFQKTIARFCFANGADFIIGSHPHVVQPMEWEKASASQKDRIVVWSMGNYVSNQRKRYTDGGAMFSLTLEKKGNSVSVKDCGYHLTWVYNPIKNGKRNYYILPVTQFETDSLFLDKESKAAFNLFTSDSRELLQKNKQVNELPAFSK